MDTCCLNRPFDDRSQLRISLEAEAVLGVLAKCESGVFALVSSEVLVIETNLNPHPQKKAFVESILATASGFAVIDTAGEARALELESRGFKPYDALHIAAAESVSADYFCTCDDRLLSKALVDGENKVKIRSPLALAQELFT